MGCKVQYRAMVRVVTAEYSYWNPLAPWRETEEEAENDCKSYIRGKMFGTGGFNQGAPARTCIDKRWDHA